MLTHRFFDVPQRKQLCGLHQVRVLSGDALGGHVEGYASTVRPRLDVLEAARRLDRFNQTVRVGLFRVS